MPQIITLNVVRRYVDGPLVGKRETVRKRLPSDQLESYRRFAACSLLRDERIYDLENDPLQISPYVIEKIRQA